MLGVADGSGLFGYMTADDCGYGLSIVFLSCDGNRVFDKFMGGYMVMTRKQRMTREWRHSTTRSPPSEHLHSFLP